MKMPGSATRIYQPVFLDSLQRLLRPNEEVRDTVDVDVETMEGFSSVKTQRGVVLVLTTQRLLVIRGKSMLGGRSALTLDFDQIEQVGGTRQGNVSIEYKGEFGSPGLWKVLLGDPQMARHWVDSISNRGAAAPAHVEEAATPPPAWTAMRPQLTGFVQELRPLTGPQSVGELFGDSRGLGQANLAMFRAFDSVEAMRMACETVAVTILSAENIGPGDLQEVMGLPGLRGNDVPADLMERVEQLSSLSRVFLGQFGDDGEEVWELWKNNDEIAGDVLCWLAVAWERLASTGRVEHL